MNNAFRFGENTNAANQFGANLGLNTAQLGFQGAPNIDANLAGLMGQPLSDVPDMSGAFGGLGSLMGQMTPQAGAQPMQTPGIVAPSWTPKAKNDVPSSGPNISSWDETSGGMFNPSSSAGTGMSRNDLRKKAK
jgi:hypothetical protein